jgi:hypothetical protein
MRRTRTVTFLMAAALALMFSARASADVNVSVSFFHEQLAPHGRWVVAGSFGDCWVPSGVATGWAPYVDGDWVYTDYGWTWESDDPWGDIPYHYGTWAWTADYGWVWVPGTVWAPSWVTWAWTDDFIGWCPVPVSFGLTASGFFGPAVVVSQRNFVFVPARQFVGVRVATVRVDPRQNPTILARAQRATAFRVSSGMVHNVGLPVARVQRAVGRNIAPRHIDPARLHASPIRATGATRAQRLSVVAPRTERAAAIRSTGARRETVARGNSARGNRPAPRVAQGGTRSRGETANRSRARSETVKRSKPQARPERARPQEQSARRPENSRAAAPSRPRHEAASSRHTASPPREAQRHEVAPSRHEASPPSHQAQRRESRPPERRMTKPQAQERPSERVAAAKPAPSRQRPAPPRKKPQQPNEPQRPQQN